MTAILHRVTGGDGDEDGGPGAALPPAGLLGRLRADPGRAPEHLALAAAERHGPAAAAWAQALRERYAFGPDELAARATRRHVALARTSGAVTGLGGALTAVPDLVALAWIQARVVFCIAAAYGFDPRDPMRPAELLVVQGLYPDPAAARAALDGLGRPVAAAYVDRKLASSGDEALAARLARFVLASGARRLAKRVVPGAASIFGAVENDRATRAIAERAVAFYRG